MPQLTYAVQVVTIPPNATPGESARLLQNLLNAQVKGGRRLDSCIQLGERTLLLIWEQMLPAPA